MSDVEFVGAKELERFLKDMPKQYMKRLDNVLSDMAVETRSNAVLGIQRGARTGRTYNRNGKSHKASAPNEFPKSDTGNIVNNITVKREGNAHYTTGSRASGAPYGFWLEFGTRHMAKRPWLEPSFKKAIRTFDKELRVE